MSNLDHDAPHLGWTVLIVAGGCLAIYAATVAFVYIVGGLIYR